MAKVKVGAKVHYNGKPENVFSITNKIKGAKTNKPVYHSGVLFNGFKSKPTKYQLDNGDIIYPNQVTVI